MSRLTTFTMLYTELEQHDKVYQKSLIELVNVLEQQEIAYSRNKADLYEPHDKGIDGGQIAFHKSQAMIRMVITGNRWGKTTASLMECRMIALGIHPYRKIPVPNRGKLYADSFPMVMENIYLKIQEWIPMSELNPKKPFTFNQQGMLTGINWVNGSLTKIGSYDQIERKAEGSNWHYIGFDEPPSRDLYVANLRGLIDFGGIMWFTMTPLSEPWIYDELWKPGLNGQKPYIHCFRGTSDDNPHIDKKALSVFMEELTAQEKEIRYYGHFAKLTGLVIDTFDQELSLIDPFDLDENWSIYEGIDPHAKKPNAALWKAVNPEGMRVVCGELSCPLGIYDFGLEVAKKRKALTAHGATLVKSIADSSLNQDDLAFKMNQLKEFQRALRNSGESVLPEIAKKKDWLLPGIQKLKDLYRPVLHDGPLGEIFGRDIKMPMQYVFKNCTLYENELLHYQWAESDLDNVKPIARHNEYIDCDRYIESKAPHYHTPGTSALFVRNSTPGAYMRIPSSERRSGRR